MTGFPAPEAMVRQAKLAQFHRLLQSGCDDLLGYLCLAFEAPRKWLRSVAQDIKWGCQTLEWVNDEPGWTELDYLLIEHFATAHGRLYKIFAADVWSEKGQVCQVLVAVGRSNATLETALP